MKRERSTLRQIAEEVGVSPTTASRALNGHAEKYRISAQTVHAVEAAAERLGFTPSHVARSLRTQRTALIGVLVPDISNPFFAAIAREITMEARQRGYAVLLADSQEQTETEADLLRHFQAREVEGLVVCPVGQCGDHLQPLVSLQRVLPVVQVDRCFAQLNLSSVTSDHDQGGYLATRHLLEHGHRHIGCLQGQPSTLPNEERLQGYFRALKEFGVSAPAGWIRGESFDQHSGESSARWLLDHHPELTAYFAFSNLIAVGAMHTILEAGRRIPDDVSLVSFDETPFSAFLAVPLSTVQQNVKGLGRTAVQVLFEQIASKRPRTVRHRIPVEMIVRSSVAAYTSSHLTETIR